MTVATAFTVLMVPPTGIVTLPSSGISFKSAGARCRRVIQASLKVRAFSSSCVPPLCTRQAAKRPRKSDSCSLSKGVSWCCGRGLKLLGVMTSWRKARLRDGTRQWALLRDLEKPELWTECYHVPTWVEYVRHNNRQTQDDAEIVARLEALHRGDCPPKTHYKIERQTVRVHDDLPLRPHSGQDLSWPDGLRAVTLSRWLRTSSSRRRPRSSATRRCTGPRVLPSKSLCRVTAGITANPFQMGNSLAIESNVVASRSPKRRSEPWSRSSMPRWRSHDAASSTTALPVCLPPAADELLSSWTAVRHCFDLPAAQRFHSFRFRGDFWEHTNGNLT